jgi:large subunit ribosomal protein L13
MTDSPLGQGLSRILAGFPDQAPGKLHCDASAFAGKKVRGRTQKRHRTRDADRQSPHSRFVTWLRSIRKKLMKTFSAKPAEVKHEWFVVDATDKVLGRVASEVALRLRGKHKAIYTPHVDTGDFIIVLNADKIRVTGNKANDKVYYRHSGHPGGIYGTKFKDMQAKHPGRALEKAVKGMLPKGPLGYAMVKKLKVYAGGSHPHTAQQPKVLEI